MEHDNKWQRQEINKLPEFTEEDLLNVQKWQTATSMMIEGKMRTPYSNEEYETGDKLKRLVDFRKFVLGVLDRQDKELHDIFLLIRDAYNQLERGQNMDMVKLGSSIRVAFKKIKELSGK